MTPDLVAYQREIWGQILADPAVIDEGAKSRRDINYMPGADLQELIGSLMKGAEPRVADIKRVMLNTYF
jgi:hypothetical protein